VSLSPRLFGIVNITEDSFSDGGRYLDPGAAIAHARALVREGAAIVDLGAAASNIAAREVDAAEEIRRLEPVIAALAGEFPLSVDSFRSEVQRFAIGRGVVYLNDIDGFAEPAFYPELAAAKCGLVVMHRAAGRGRAQAAALSAAAIWEEIASFFAARVDTLERAGIVRDRLILDPGMGLFLSSRPQISLAVLAGLGRLKRQFGLPVLVSVSRKSFLRALTGRPTSALGAATLAAELSAATAGADYIRTHDPGALRDGLIVARALRAASVQLGE
jgi:dihydropteroate synthase type 2